MKIGKWNCTKSKTDTEKQYKQPIEWERIFTNYTTNKDGQTTYSSQTNNNKKTVKNDQRSQLDFSLKKTYRWPTGTSKQSKCNLLSLVIRKY